VYLSKVSDIVDTEMRSKAEGFTLIELMMVVAIIAILAAISVPNFMSYRNKARIASAVSTMGQVRGAMASYAASYLGNPFPPDDAITDWNSLATVGNANGASLKSTEEEAGIAFISYDRYDSDDDDEDDTYQLIVRVLSVPGTLDGSTIIVSPQGVFKQTTGS
jgi:prepilin-type N-terminal cleavage/methylation domain-containing protein